MCGITFMKSLILMTAAHSKELATNQRGDRQNSVFVENMVDNFFHRALEPRPFQHAHLDDATLMKPSHLAINPRTTVGVHPDGLEAGKWLPCDKKVTPCSRAATLPSASPFLQRPRSIIRAGGIEDDLPPELSEDPRDFRARLVAAQRSEVAGNSSEGEPKGTSPGWIYETSLLEQGSVLLGATVQSFGFGLRQQYFHKCVILLVTHDITFTKGIILNRPTALQLYGWPVWCGGDCEEGGLFRPKNLDNPQERAAESLLGQMAEVTCLHRLESESIKNMSTRIIKNIYNIPFDKARELVAAGQAKKEDFWVFVGYAGWRPGQLQGELERKSWYLASADSALLLSELLTLSGDPLMLPRINTGTRHLLDGGDGLETWKRLAANIGRKDDTEGDFSDRMLREWVRVHLTEEGQTSMSMKNRANVSGSDEIVPVGTGTVLVASSAEPFILENQYLHKSILLVVQTVREATIALVLNRPTGAIVAFKLPGKGPNAGKVVKRRVSFGGEYAQRGSSGGENTVLLHHKPELGGTQLGDSGLYGVSDEFTGEADDLLVLNGFTAWTPTKDLQRKIKAGTFSILPPNKKVNWQHVWELADVSTGVSDNLEERIADVKRVEQNSTEEKRAVLKDRAVRVTNKSCEVWESLVSEMGRSVADTKGWEAQLADEALFEWSKIFISEAGTA